MTPAEYRTFVTSMLTFPGALSYERCAIGAATEASEALAYVAKCRWQGHSFDRETLALELGDVLFYLIGMDAVLEWPHEPAAWENRKDRPLFSGHETLMACRELFAATAPLVMDPWGVTPKDASLNDAWGVLYDMADGLGFSLADLATMNVAKLRERFAASGGEFSAEVSAGRGEQ